MAIQFQKVEKAEIQRKERATNGKPAILQKFRIGS
jgi:hypothetical protein